MAEREIVLGVTGSIGAYKAADLVRRLKEQGCAVTCVMTKEAAQFITPLTLQALSERKVYTELFGLEESAVTPPPVLSPKAERRPFGPNTGGGIGPSAGGGVIHTQLADHANLIVIAPATANVIAKLAHGLADDLLTCVALAATAPVLIAPAMNVHMYEHPTVQDNITRLKVLRYQFVGPQVGKLACGYDAIGHLAEVDEIVRAALALLTSPPRVAVRAALTRPQPPRSVRKVRAHE